MGSVIGAFEIASTGCSWLSRAALDYSQPTLPAYVRHVATARRPGAWGGELIFGFWCRRVTHHGAVNEWCGS
ncbi:hypothetical protein GCM10020219_075590 [Nonomuraea dietziae]